MGEQLTAQIEAALGVRVTRAQPLGVGFGLHGLRAQLADGRRIAVKAGQPRRPGHLLLEARMLRDLRRLSKLPVPKVYHAEETLLIMAWIDSAGTISPSAERHAAELLAELHSTPRPHFGFDYDTVIGPLPQPNPQMQSWVDFFREQRLLLMAHAAHQEGQLSGMLLARLEKLADRLEDYLPDPRHPALLHGDLWTGNVLVKDGRIAGLIDPAIYYGDREIELAFTTMFSTFGRAFFDAYEALSPLEPDFHELRRALYNLYPTLVHVRLFGASYLPPIESTLSRLGL